MAGLFAIPIARDKLHLLPFYFQWLRLKELNYISSPLWKPDEPVWTCTWEAPGTLRIWPHRSDSWMLNCVPGTKPARMCVFYEVRGRPAQKIRPHKGARRRRAVQRQRLQCLSLLCWRASSCPSQKPSEKCTLSMSLELVRKTQRFAAGAGRDLDEQLFMALISKAGARSNSRARP